MLNEGSQALDFTLKNVDGEDITLSSFRGKKVVVYFYPKDDTPGCTKEACSFRDWYEDILEKGAVVIGISPDDHASHVKFKEKYNLPFYLLSDPDHQVAEGYGAWGEKNMYGKKSFGIIRSTFLIDEEGNVLKVFKKVNTETHGEDVLKLL
jgi:thioredoxin-dependent peroxiredoxin